AHHRVRRVRPGAGDQVHHPAGEAERESGRARCVWGAAVRPAVRSTHPSVGGPLKRVHLLRWRLRIWALLTGPAHQDKVGATVRRWGIDPLVGLRVAVYVIRQFLEVGPAAPRGARSDRRPNTVLDRFG